MHNLDIDYYHYSSLNSTNDTVKDQIREGSVSRPFVVTADHQVMGRGTRGRTWFSEPGSQLLYSFAFPQPAKELNNDTLLTRTAKALSDTVSDVYKINLEKEWPNDLLLNKKKCAGILIEMLIHKDRQWLIVGIGLNVNTTQFPDHLRFSATSFFLENHSIYDKSLILRPLTERLFQALSQLK